MTRTDRRRFNGRTPRGLTAEQRFWSKVQGGPPSECWLWTASTDPSGYGMFHVGGQRRLIRAHAWAFEAARGPVPMGLHLDHLCEVKRCVNPWHLEPVTCLENVRSRVPRERGACLYGHPYAEFSRVYPAKDGSDRRQCAECNREYGRAYRNLSPIERERRKAAGIPVVDLAAVFAATELRSAAA